MWIIEEISLIYRDSLLRGYRRVEAVNKRVAIESSGMTEKLKIAESQ